MRNLPFITFLTLLLIFSACKDNNTSESDTTQNPQDSVIAETRPTVIPIYTWVDRLRLRTKPDSKSEILMEFPEGTTLYFLGEKSEHTQKVTLRGKTYDEPWLKVGTADGTQGWIYGGAVRFNEPKLDKNPSPYDACFQQFYDQGYNEYNTCAKRVRKSQLKQDSRYLTQLGKGLSINLFNGETKVFKPTATTGENPGEGYSAYDYMYYIPQMGFFVIGALGYEYYEYQLVNDKIGNTISIWGYPKPSPDYRHLIVTNADLEAGFTTNGIQLFGFVNNRFKLLWQEELDDMEPHLAKWMDEKTVEVTLRSPPSATEKEERTVTMKVENGKLIGIN